jgi:hypothetical protein
MPLRIRSSRNTPGSIVGATHRLFTLGCLCQPRGMLEDATQAHKKGQKVYKATNHKTSVADFFHDFENVCIGWLTYQNALDMILRLRVYSDILICAVDCSQVLYRSEDRYDDTIIDARTEAIGGLVRAANRFLSRAEICCAQGK